MKLKPLIKTHWLASQNPMTVGLGGLKTLVFNPPQSVLNFEFSKPAAGATQIPGAASIQIKPADSDEIRDVINQRFTLAKDLFWVLFSGIDLSHHRAPTAALIALAESLEFHYENGDCFSLVGIFRQEGLPLFLNPKFYLFDSSCSWEKAIETRSEELGKYLKITAQQKKNDDYRKTWILILEILAWAFQRKRQVGDLDVLWSADSLNNQTADKNSVRSSLPRTAYPMEDIDFSKSLPLAVTMMADTTLENTARLQVWQGYEAHSAESSILHFHSVTALFELENFFSSSASKTNSISLQPINTASETGPTSVRSSSLEKETISKALPDLIWQPCFLTVESGEKNIAQALAKFEHLLTADKIYFVNHQQVAAANFKPFLKIREDDASLQMAVSFKSDELQLEHLNFPAALRPALAPFWGGLDHFFKIDRKDVASRHLQYRSHDLLFLRHQGLTLFCLFEMMNWILKRPLSSGENIEFVSDSSSKEFDQQFEKVIHYLQISVPALLGKALIPFQELVSPKVKELFVDFLEKLHQSLMLERLLVLQKGKIIEIKDIQLQILPLIRFLILHFIESSQGKFLTRSQAPLGEKFLYQLPHWTDAVVITSDATSLRSDPLWVEIGRFDKYLISLLFELSDLGVDVELNGVPLLGQDNPFEFIFSVSDSAASEDGNWFDLHPQIFFNGTRVQSEEVKINFGQGDVGFIEYQGQLYRIDKKQMPSLKSLQKFWNKIKGKKEIHQRNSFGEKIYRLERSQALELLMLRAQGIEVQGTGEWKRIFEYFDQGLGIDRINLPEEMQTMMLPHQLEGAQWLHDLYELKLGSILADEMGLGKTFQVLSFLVSLQSRDKLKKSLIVVPTSLVYNWLDEKKKFAPSLPFHIFQSSEKESLTQTLKSEEPLVLITTYGLLNENAEFFQSQNWNVLAFDEAQNLKNITSLRAVSARKLNGQFKISITGTPMENNYLEYFSLCDLVVPGCLGDIDAFRKEYFNKPVSSESIRNLKLITKPLLLRRTKLQVQLSLPEKTVQKVILPFGVKQKEIYMKMAMTFSKQVESLIQDQGERKAQIAMFSALMRLRQICSDPSAVPGVVYHEQPAKIEHFLSSLQDHLENQESVIVFTQFLSTLGRIEKELQLLKVPTFVLQGNVSSKERLRLISAFQNSDEPGVMLMTLKTGGVGLNLTKASVVYHLEPWWNPAVENQATDRAHRMGQKKNVKVFNLLIEGSLEERIADLKLKKQGSFDRLFGNDEQVNDVGFEGSSGLSKEDFFYLLK